MPGETLMARPRRFGSLRVRQLREMRASRRRIIGACVLMLHRYARFGLGLLIGLVLVTACGRAAILHGDADRSGDVVADIQSDVLMSPAVEAGWAGWCMSVLDSGPTEPCFDVRAHGAVLAERWVRGVGKRLRGVAVVANEATAVVLSTGTVFATREEPTLVGHVRAVVVEVADVSSHIDETIVRQGFRALNRKRQPISGAGDYPPLGYEVRASGWHAPAPPPSGICSIHAQSADFHAIRGGVVGEVRAYHGLVDDALLNCAATEYVDGNASLLGGMLVDASRAGARPRSWPAVSRLVGHHGIYQSPVDGGQMVARRVTGGWLFVADSPFTTHVSLATRLALLSDLSDEVSDGA